MRAETVVTAIRIKQANAELTLEQGTRLLMAWNAIQNLEFMKKMYEERVKSMVTDALKDVGHVMHTDSLDLLEIELLDILELV